MFLLILGAVFLALSAAGLIRARRDPGNAAFLFAALIPLNLWIYSTPAGRSLLESMFGSVLMLTVLGPATVSVLGLIVLLVVNGLSSGNRPARGGMQRNGSSMGRGRRRGRGPARSRSLGTGAALAVACAAVVLLLLDGRQGPVLVATGLAITIAYLLVSFAVFLIYSLGFSRARQPPKAGVVVVLGSALNRGEVSAMLADRLDAACRICDSIEPGAGPLLIVSGGPGRAETRSEAAAMAEYLAAKGVPQERLIVEEKARTTRENIRFTKSMLEAKASTGGNVDGAVVVVTSDFHVLRTAGICRRMGLKADVVGSRSAPGLLPATLLREFTLTLGEYTWAHATVALSITTSLIALAASAG
ncbi:YdcF family protein [Arthrobacter sp. H14]|uniref:YdcF family protein n=1 Tax=Arthrobacter sp. H14 TaxID=1312959 RepID=UPI0004BAA90B|nr:YdcF family protein [Arthrobacter sp. H14]